MISDDRFVALCKDTSIVRYPQKIRSVQENAVFIQDVASEHGSFGQMIAGWPKNDFAGLLEKLKKDGNRLGRTTAQYFLRCKFCFKNPQMWRSKIPHFLVSVISRFLRSASPFSADGHDALGQAAV